MRKHLYMLLDKYILRQHEYITVESHCLDYCNMMWDRLRVQGFEMYHLLSVRNTFDCPFYFIVRRKL